MATSSDRVAALLALLGLDEYLPPGRLRQIATFGAVGVTGIPIDLALTTTAMPVLGVLAAQAAGWIVAASWNHAWNRRLTWNTTQPLYTTWLQYLAVDSGRLALRIGVVALLVTIGVMPLAATLAGIAAATLAGFLGFDRVVFDD